MSLSLSYIFLPSSPSISRLVCISLSLPCLPHVTSLYHSLQMALVFSPSLPLFLSLPPFYIPLFASAFSASNPSSSISLLKHTRISSPPLNSLSLFNFSFFVFTTVLLLFLLCPLGQIFDTDGDYLLEVTPSGEGDDEFKYPTGVATDINDNIYVCNDWNGRVLKFSPDGTFIKRVDSDEDGLRYPNGIAITDDGKVVVVDYGNDCVKVFA